MDINEEHALRQKMGSPARGPPKETKQHSNAEECIQQPPEREAGEDARYRDDTDN